MESHKRSILKAMSWRVFAFFITSGVVLVLTGRMDLAGGIGLADSLIKVVLFYVHERAWNRIAFGRIGKQDYEI